MLERIGRLWKRKSDLPVVTPAQAREPVSVAPAPEVIPTALPIGSDVLAPELHEAFMRSSLELETYFSSFQRGAISAEVFASLTTPLVRRLMNHALANEQRDIRGLEAREGFESLTTDTTGHRSEEWFKATGMYTYISDTLYCFKNSLGVIIFKLICGLLL